jgi:hypothetical protein
VDSNVAIMKALRSKGHSSSVYDHVTQAVAQVRNAYA